MVTWGCVIQKVCSAYSQMCFKPHLSSQLKYSCQFYSSVLVKLESVWRELLYFSLKGSFRQENEIISPSFRVAVKLCMCGCMCVCGVCVCEAGVEVSWQYFKSITLPFYPSLSSFFPLPPLPPLFFPSFFLSVHIFLPFFFSFQSLPSWGELRTDALLSALVSGNFHPITQDSRSHKDKWDCVLLIYRRHVRFHSGDDVDQIISLNWCPWLNHFENLS